MLSIIFVLLATVVVPIFYLYWSSYFPFIRALKKEERRALMQRKVNDGIANFSTIPIHHHDLHPT